MLQTCWRTCGVRRRGWWRVRRARRGRTECRSCPASRSSSTSPRTGRAGPSGTHLLEHWARYLLPPERLERGGPCSLLKPVFRIQDILVWIRIRGSMPLTNGSGMRIRILLFSSLIFKTPTIQNHVDPVDPDSDPEYWLKLRGMGTQRIIERVPSLVSSLGLWCRYKRFLPRPPPRTKYFFPRRTLCTI